MDLKTIFRFEVVLTLVAFKSDRKSCYRSIINALLFLLLSSSPDMACCCCWRRAGLLLRGSCCGLVVVLTVIWGLCRVEEGRVFTTKGCGVFGFELRDVTGVTETSVPFGRLIGICGVGGDGCCWISLSPFSFLMSITSGWGSASSSSSTGGFRWGGPPHLQGMGKGIGIGMGRRKERRP